MEKVIDKTKKVAQDVCKSVKTCSRLAVEEARVRELYYKLGREYYNDLENDVDDVSGLETLCEEIKLSLAKIASMKKRLSSKEHMKICPSCGKINSGKNLYCGRCATKL